MTTSTADSKQIAGDHYKTASQHWNMLLALGYGPEYYVGQATKYLTRWRKKNGLRDLLKGQHFIEKMIEVVGDHGDEWLPYGHVHDVELLKGIVNDHLKSHLNHFFDSNDVDNTSRAVCISVMFAHRVETLHDAVSACDELAKVEKLRGLQSKDLEPPVAMKFDFVEYIDDGMGITWKCHRCGQVLHLAMDQPPATTHSCVVSH